VAPPFDPRTIGGRSGRCGEQLLDGGTASSSVVDARGHTVEMRLYHGVTPTPQTAGSWDAVTYTYDRRGYQTKVADTLGNDWTYTYDVRGRQTEVDDPDKGKTTVTYDNAGNVLTSTDARGKKIAFLVDALGRERASYDNQVGGTLRAQWIYDTVAKGYLSQSTRMVGSAPYQVKILDYNDDYQPGNTQVIIPASETGLAGTYNYNHTYNPDGSPKSTSIPQTNTGLPAETLTYGYTALGAPTSLDSLYGTQNLSYIDDADYNALGELDQVDRYTGSGGHVYTSYTRELETEPPLDGLLEACDLVSHLSAADVRGALVTDHRAGRQKRS
jgi:YD repeat-containing protein